jgi:hypothetical protein
VFVVQSKLGRVSCQLSWENRGNLYGKNKQFFTFNVGMKNKQRAGEKRTKARERRVVKLWSMLERFGVEN